MNPLATHTALFAETRLPWTREAEELRPDACALGWLTEPGLLTERVRAHRPAIFGLRVVDERHGLLAPADARALGVADLSAFFREIELVSGTTPLVFAQTLVPAATLAAEPWLALLGTDALGPRLALMGGAIRDPLEFARLAPDEPLFARALRGRPSAAAWLWARRARYRLASHCLIVQEVFLPEALQ